MMANTGLTAGTPMEENCRKSLVKYSHNCRSGLPCCGPRFLNALLLRQHSRTYACSPMGAIHEEQVEIRHLTRRRLHIHENNIEKY